MTMGLDAIFASPYGAGLIFDAFVTVEEPKVLRGGSLVERDWRMPVPFPTGWSTRSHQRA